MTRVKCYSDGRVNLDIFGKWPMIVMELLRTPVDRVPLGIEIDEKPLYRALEQKMISSRNTKHVLHIHR